MTEGSRPSRVSVREEGRTTFLSDENRNSAMRFRSRTRSSSAEEVEAMPFARDLGLIDHHQEWTPEEWPESRPGEIPIRRLSYPVMQWSHQQGSLMTGWEKYPHLFLDFSDDLFSLATMQPLDFRWRRKEGEDRSGPGARSQRRPQESESIVGKSKTSKSDNNKLRDSDFDPAKDVGIASSAFASLRTLSLSKNLLVYPIIVLPRLKESDSSHNRLIQVPVLSGLAQSETLNSSHNKIEELEPKSFRDGKASNSRSLDLRFNRLQVFPKDLHGVFDEFARSSQMHTLRLSQNPFCCIFPEYHMLAASSMPRLRSSDKVTLTGHWRSESSRYGGSFFGMAVSNYVTGDGKLLESVNSVRSFPDSAAEPLPEVNRLLQLKSGVEVSSMDKARVFFLQDRVEDLAGQVKDRERIADNGGSGVGVSRKTIQRSRMATTDQEIPLLSSMTHESDSAIAGHTLIINSSTIVFQKASHLASSAADRVEAMFDDIKVKMNVKTGKMDPHLLRVAREDASKTFAEQVCMLAERHPDLRSISIRTLAKCGSISNEIGPPCMNSLASSAQADDETRRAVLEVTQEIILPAMQEGQIVEVANMNCEGMEDILESAVPEISAAVKSISRSGVNSKMLVKMMRSCEAAIRSLEIAVRSEAAALRVIKEDVSKAIVEYSSIDSVFSDKSACWIFVSGVHVSLGCSEHHRKEALASLSSAGLSTHLELLQNMEESGKSKETPGPALCRKAGSTMELLASSAQEDDTLDESMAYGNGARVSIEENPFVRVALAAPSAPSTADPVQSAGAMKCSITVSYNEKQRNRFGKYIVSHSESMDKKKNKIWGYIDGTHWREISRSCEMYKKHEENAKDPSRGYGTSESMNFQGVTDPNRIRNVFMHKMLVSVIDFLKAFSALADGDSKELCTRVSQVFNEMGRESVLFKSLQVMVLDLIPMPTMKVIVMILLYDMQVAANVQGSKDAACRNLRWQESHGLCSETLSQSMHSAPSIRYEAVELMNRHKVLGHKQLHTSFISDSLDRSEMHRLVRAFDLLLPELEDYQPNERVLQLAWAEMPEEGAKSFFSMAMGLVRTGGARSVASTTHRLIISGQSRHGAAKRPCGLCPPESFCPIGPEIFKSYSYADLTRIYSSDAQLSISGRTERRNREVTAEKFDMFIFHQVDAQREFKERLMVLSGLDPLMRIKLHQEMLVNRAAKSKTASRIARTTWGFRQSEEGERSSLFSLTESNFFEFQANFSSWIPNSVTEEKAYGSDNEYDGGESDEEAQEFTKASDFSKAMAKAAKDARTSKFSNERREQEEPISSSRQSERQERRYQDPPNKWLSDGIATEKAVSDTLWKYLPEAEIQQIKKDRSQGSELTEQELFEVPGASREKEIKHMHQVMKDKRKAILTQLFKCPIRNSKSVSFDPGPIPILHSTFQPDHGREEQVDIRFSDDCARESWRRNLQSVSQKTFSGGSQWGRVYDDHREDAARHAVKTNRAAKFFAHD